MNEDEIIRPAYEDEAAERAAYKEVQAKLRQGWHLETAVDSFSDGTIHSQVRLVAPTIRSRWQIFVVRLNRLWAIGRDTYIRVYPNPGVGLKVGRRRFALSVMGGLEVFRAGPILRVRQSHSTATTQRSLSDATVRTPVCGYQQRRIVHQSGRRVHEHLPVD